MSAAIIHGVDGRPARAPFPPLGTAELAPVFAEYPALGPVLAVRWHAPRPFAASGLVACAAGTVFVKRHDARLRAPRDLAAEHGFMAHLRAAGLAVPEVLRTRTGATAVAGPRGTYELHAALPHADPYRDAVSWSAFQSLAHARAAGAALARLHRAASGYDAPARQGDLLVACFDAFGGADPLGAIAARCARAPALRAALAGRPWRADCTRHLLPFHAAARDAMGDAAPLWGHNDFHASNALWEGAEVAALLDFGLANRTSAVFDLATAIERNAVAWLELSAEETDIARPEAACALLDGYAAVQPLTRGQRRAVQAILPLVHAEFALSELAYFRAFGGGAAEEDAAYAGFLLGHAAWFATAHGTHFLRALA